MITALNGRLPSVMLVVADTGANGPQQLRTDAAASWARMLAAGMPRGCLRSGYRTLAQQSAQDPALALPAGQSEHGEGIAADVDEPARSWIAAHGLPFGWRIGFVPGEPWHAQYDRPDQHPSSPAPTALAPLAQEDTDMLVIRNQEPGNGSIALIGESYVGEFAGDDPNGIAAAIALWGDLQPDGSRQYRNVSGAVYAEAVSRARSRMQAAAAAPPPASPAPATVDLTDVLAAVADLKGALAGLTLKAQA